MRAIGRFVVAAGAVLLMAAALPDAARDAHPARASIERGGTGIRSLDHLIFVVQENRRSTTTSEPSPAPTGSPAGDGRLDVCIPDPFRARCSKPYHSRRCDSAAARTAGRPR